ncbi:unnamed protein product, partial [Heterotrigona itama]
SQQLQSSQNAKKCHSTRDSNYIAGGIRLPGCSTLITETEEAQEFNNLIYIPRGC